MKVTTWQATKIKVDNAAFKDDWNFTRTDEREFHKYGTLEHSLDTYKAYCGKSYEYKIYAYYNVCSKCSNEIRNKYLVAVNEKENLCYVKFFIKNGNRVGY